MDAQEIKQRLSHWSRQTIIFALLLREKFAGNPFESPSEIQRATEKARFVFDDLWQEAQRESSPDALAMHFVNKVIVWANGKEDLSQTMTGLDETGS